MYIYLNLLRKISFLIQLVASENVTILVKSKKMVPRNECKTYPNQFCYVCGLFVTIKGRRPINARIYSNMKAVFGKEVQNRVKTWVPKSWCDKCRLHKLIAIILGRCPFPHHQHEKNRLLFLYPCRGYYSLHCVANI